MRWWPVAVVLAAAGAGYAATGRPDLPARLGRIWATDPPGRAAIERARPLFFDLRERDGGWVALSNALTRGGEPAEAAAVLGTALKAQPRSVLLSVELGNALSLHAGGLPPAAELAFARASELDPADPAPRYFRALALLRAGRAGEARSALQALLAAASPGPRAEQIERDLAAARASEAALTGL